MEMNENIFENIIVAGNSVGSQSIFDEIEAEEEKMEDNQDLYDVLKSVNKVLEAPARYNEIQSVDTTVDCNRGHVIITGTCKHDLKAHGKDLNQVDDAVNDNQFTDDIIGTFATDMAKIAPSMKVDYEISDDNLPGMGKTQFTVYITRK